MYPYEIRHAIADPQGAAEIALTPCFFSIDLLVCGKKFTKCFATQMGPTPGPPPPCGIEKVLFIVNPSGARRPNPGPRTLYPRP